MLGKTLDGKYHIGRLLGSGGMGSVYAAEDVRTGQTVAVKIIHADLTEGTAMVRRFQREARAAGAIDTDHIARCFDAGTDPETGSPYMVLEYLVGEDLHHTLKRLGPLPPQVALRILAQACVGVSKAHEAEVVHRDIKPANIFLAKGEGGVRTVKVLDFGVAKMRRDQGDIGDTSSGGLTRTGSILGSPLYMSPEQARSVKNIDHRSDIWSLGVVLYQSVAGRTPFEHISGLGDLIIALCSDLPPSVQHFAPWVSPEIARVIDQALRIDPVERFQTAAEMLDAVLELLPDGFEVRDEMLVELDDATYDTIAPSYLRRPITLPLGRRMLASDAFLEGPPSSPRSRRSPAPSYDAASGSEPRSKPRGPTEPFAGTMQGSATPISASSGTPPEVPQSRPPQSTQTSVATTGPGLPNPGSRDPAPRPPRQVSTITVAIACVVAGGAGVYALTRSTVHDGGATRAPAVTIGEPIGPPARPAPTAVVSPAGPDMATPLDVSASSAARAMPPPAPASTADAAAGKPSPSPRLRSTGAGDGAAVGAARSAAPIDYNTFGGRK